MFRFESVVPFNLRVQMESNTPQDFVALTLQIKTLTASVEDYEIEPGDEAAAAVRG